MNNRRTINDVITYNPSYSAQAQPAAVSYSGSAPNWQNQQNTFILNNSNLQPGQTYTVAQLKAENEKLRNTIEAWQTKKPSLEEQQIVDESGIEEQLNKRISSNDSKISELESQLKQQEQVMAAYQQKFAQFQQNLSNLMKLDKDIHSKLVNPEQSSTLQKNVKNVMIALNSGASYEQVLQMIQNIRV